MGIITTRRFRRLRLATKKTPNDRVNNEEAQDRLLRTWTCQSWAGFLFRIQCICVWVPIYNTYVPVSTPWLPNGITTPQILVVSGPVVEQIGGLDLFFILFLKKWVTAAVKNRFVAGSDFRRSMTRHNREINWPSKFFKASESGCVSLQWYILALKIA